MPFAHVNHTHGCTACTPPPCRISRARNAIVHQPSQPGHTCGLPTRTRQVGIPFTHGNHTHSCIARTHTPMPSLPSMQRHRASTVPTRTHVRAPHTVKACPSHTATTPWLCTYAHARAPAESQTHHAYSKPSCFMCSTWVGAQGSPGGVSAQLRIGPSHHLEPFSR